MGFLKRFDGHRQRWGNTSSGIRLRGISWMTRSLVRDDSSKYHDSTGITPSPSRLDLRQAMRMSIEWRKYRRGHLCGRGEMPGTLWDLLAEKSSLGIENGQTCSDWRYLILFSWIISKWMLSDESTFRCQNVTVDLFVLNTNTSRIATLNRSTMNLRNVPRTYHIARIWKKGIYTTSSSIASILIHYQKHRFWHVSCNDGLNISLQEPQKRYSCDSRCIRNVAEKRQKKQRCHTSARVK